MGNLITLLRNPYDGHTLAMTLRPMGHISGHGHKGDVFVNLGYRGHNYEGPARMHIVGQKLKGILHALAHWMKRRTAIVKDIEQLKSQGRLERNFLRSKMGDKLNALLNTCVHNLRLMPNKLCQQEDRLLVFALPG